MPVEIDDHTHATHSNTQQNNYSYTCKATLIEVLTLCTLNIYLLT